ncbi:uncharacterized protein LOC129742496 [Uranotaenia lowii]|uniref:uncharacterized protein LOC129742496 n=1 Tax=Uranotaenia lowii TaxID=190385 RepID=UPI00247887C5|nr:uncharacterized protein LOC129742496 [Uranotaenia lowii]
MDCIRQQPKSENSLKLIYTIHLMVYSLADSYTSATIVPPGSTILPILHNVEESLAGPHILPVVAHNFKERIKALDTDVKSSVTQIKSALSNNLNAAVVHLRSSVANKVNVGVAQLKSTVSNKLHTIADMIQPKHPQFYAALNSPKPKGFTLNNMYQKKRNSMYSSHPDKNIKSKRMSKFRKSSKPVNYDSFMTDLGISGYKHFENAVIRDLERREEQKVEATMHTLFDNTKHGKNVINAQKRNPISETDVYQITAKDAIVAGTLQQSSNIKLENTTFHPELSSLFDNSTFVNSYPSTSTSTSTSTQASIFPFSQFKFERNYGKRNFLVLPELQVKSLVPENTTTKPWFNITFENLEPLKSDIVRNKIKEPKKRLKHSSKASEKKKYEYISPALTTTISSLKPMINNKREPENKSYYIACNQFTTPKNKNCSQKFLSEFEFPTKKHHSKLANIDAATSTVFPFTTTLNPLLMDMNKLKRPSRHTATKRKSSTPDTSYRIAAKGKKFIDKARLSGYRGSVKFSDHLNNNGLNDF